MWIPARVRVDRSSSIYRDSSLNSSLRGAAGGTGAEGPAERKAYPKDWGVYTTCSPRLCKLYMFISSTVERGAHTKGARNLLTARPRAVHSAPESPTYCISPTHFIIWSHGNRGSYGRGW